MALILSIDPHIMVTYCSKYTTDIEEQDNSMGVQVYVEHKRLVRQHVCNKYLTASREGEAQVRINDAEYSFKYGFT